MHETSETARHCIACGYDLRALTADRCPECGSPVGRRAPRPGAAVRARVGFNPIRSTLGAIWLIAHPHEAIGAGANLNRRFASVGCRLIPGYLILVVAFVVLMIVVEWSSLTSPSVARAERLAFQADTLLLGIARAVLNVAACFLVALFFLRLWRVPLSRWRVFDIGMTLGAAGILSTIMACSMLPLTIGLGWLVGDSRIMPHLQWMGVSFMVFESLVTVTWLCIAVASAAERSKRFVAFLAIALVVGARWFYLPRALRAWGDLVEPHVLRIAESIT